MIPFIQPDLTRVEAQAAYDVVLGGFLNEGRLTQKFAEQFAKLVGTKFAIPTTNCTSAIAIALMSLDIKGKEVIIPDITMIGTAMGVVLSGNIPVVVDVKMENACIELQNVENAIGKNTAAIIPVHYNGRNALTKELVELAKKHSLDIIEDAAGCLGSLYGDSESEQIGTKTKFGCYSLASTKIAVSGQGGVLVTNDRSLHEKATRLKDWGRFNDKGITHDFIGFNFKFTDLQAAIALVQIERLPKLIERKREIYSLYKEKIKNHMFSIDTPPGYCPWYVDIEGQDFEFIFKKNNIGCSPIWPALHQQPAMKKFVESNDKLFPNATVLAKKVLWLPSSTKLLDEEIDYICDIIINSN